MLRWESFYGARETKDNFILLRSKVTMQTLPKRLFRDGGQIEEFRALLRERLGSRAKLG